MATRERNQGQVNGILEALAPAERRLIEPAVEYVGLAPGQILCGAGDAMEHAYFPRHGVISLFASTEGSADVGVGLIGSAGMFGLGLAAGRPVSALAAESQGHGSADRIDAARFASLLGRSAGLRDAMLRYGGELADQQARNTACVSLHPVRRRLARWLLDVTAGSHSDQLASTQAATATALGIRRAAVNVAAGSLQRLGLIRSLRGDVAILDRAGLRALACSCSRAAAHR